MTLKIGKRDLIRIFNLFASLVFFFLWLKYNLTIVKRQDTTNAKMFIKITDQ
ncbi:hypothetical protein Hanom_Chr00s000907g01670021 [Helianthus anomalus]